MMEFLLYGLPGTGIALIGQVLAHNILSVAHANPECLTACLQQADITSNTVRAVSVMVGIMANLGIHALVEGGNS